MAPVAVGRWAGRSDSREPGRFWCCEGPLAESAACRFRIRGHSVARPRIHTLLRHGEGRDSVPAGLSAVHITGIPARGTEAATLSVDRLKAIVKQSTDGRMEGSAGLRRPSFFWPAAGPVFSLEPSHDSNRQTSKLGGAAGGRCSLRLGGNSVDRSPRLAPLAGSRDEWNLPREGTGLQLVARGREPAVAEHRDQHPVDPHHHEWEGLPAVAEFSRLEPRGGEGCLSRRGDREGAVGERLQRLPDRRARRAGGLVVRGWRR